MEWPLSDSIDLAKKKFEGAGLANIKIKMDEASPPSFGSIIGYMPKTVKVRLFIYHLPQARYAVMQTYQYVQCAKSGRYRKYKEYYFANHKEFVKKFKSALKIERVVQTHDCEKLIITPPKINKIFGGDKKYRIRYNVVVSVECVRMHFHDGTTLFGDDAPNLDPIWIIKGYCIIPDLSMRSFIVAFDGDNIYPIRGRVGNYKFSNKCNSTRIDLNKFTHNDVITIKEAVKNHVDQLEAKK